MPGSSYVECQLTVEVNVAWPSFWVIGYHRLPVRFWSGAGAAVIEIVATLLTVKLLVPMSGLEQAVPNVG